MGKTLSNLSGNTAYIMLSCEIEDYTTQSFCGLLSNLPSSVKNLYLMIATEGGAVSQGIALYNLLHALPYHITTHNISNVDSIGNIVFLAGKRRLATANAAFLIHGVKSKLNKQDMMENTTREKLSLIEEDNRRLKKIYQENTNLTSKDLDELFISGYPLSAESALDRGIINEICELQFPKQQKLHYIESKSNDND